jgi:hypothetical protein
MPVLLFRKLIWSTRDRCYDFLNIFAETFSKNIGVFCSNYCMFLQKCDHNIGFWEKRQFFRKLAKSHKIVIIDPSFQVSRTDSRGLLLTDMCRVPLLEELAGSFRQRNPPDSSGWKSRPANKQKNSSKCKEKVLMFSYSVCRWLDTIPKPFLNLGRYLPG